MTVVRTPVRGYFWQSETFDSDVGSSTTGESAKVAFLAPKDSALHPKSFHAIEYVHNGEAIVWEFVGHVEPKFSLARGGLHHYEGKVERAAA